jgi:type II secretory pathway predicted ATPase ExeA
MNPQSTESPFRPMISSFDPSEASETGDCHNALAELIAESTPAASSGNGSIRSLLPSTNFLEFYGLSDDPFADCVHPSFFYRTESHSDAFRSMMLAVEFNASLGLLTGPSGTGKTLVSQLLLEHLDAAKYHVILVLVTPGLTKTGLLREILSELNLALPVGINRVQDLVKLLSNHIIETHERGQRLVIIVDECHLLDADCLHIIRTISNIEVPERKLTTSLLFGEARLAQRLEHPTYDSLRNRIYLRARLQPLRYDETAQYVKFRLLVAGRMTELFTPDALAVLHTHTGGICRSLNKLAMLSLVEGAIQQQPVVDATTVITAAIRM